MLPVETPVFSPTDEYWMREALALARQAAELGEVPVGAVIVSPKGERLAGGFNQPIATHDPSAHAEMMALRAACRALGNYRLPGASLYVTLEPCAMCMGAMLHARLRRVVFAAPDPKTGACGGVIDLPSIRQLNHQTRVEGGLMAEQAGELLRGFFRARRRPALNDRGCAAYESPDGPGPTGAPATAG
jgi:tRNA(adenine34) deaminase